MDTVKQLYCTTNNMVGWKCPACSKEFAMPYKTCQEVVRLRCSCKRSMELDATALLDWFCMYREARNG